MSNAVGPPQAELIGAKTWNKKMNIQSASRGPNVELWFAASQHR